MVTYARKERRCPSLQCTLYTNIALAHKRHACYTTYVTKQRMVTMLEQPDEWENPLTKWWEKNIIKLIDGEIND